MVSGVSGETTVRVVVGSVVIRVVQVRSVSFEPAIKLVQTAAKTVCKCAGICLVALQLTAQLK